MMQQWADYLDDLAEDGKVIVILDAPRSPSSLIFGAECGLIFRDLDVEVANQARPPLRQVFAQVREQRRRSPPSSLRASHGQWIVASISEKSPDGVLPLLPIEAADFSQSPGWGTAITAIRFLSALFAVRRRAGSRA